MVLIESKKYACETCIKGHRSSGCKHTDRPLYIIKPKGRPQSQCEHCRELRKTKQVHVKCTCQQKGEATAGGGQTTSDSGRKGLKKILQGAAFPNGLPEDLEATVSRQLSSEGVSFDSEYGSCSCMSTGGECHCAKATSRGAKRKAIEPRAAAASCSSESLVSLDNQRSSNHAPTRMPEYRHVLPKPSLGPLARHNPHHHESTLYSPYGRAYDHARPHHPDLHQHSSRPNVELPHDRNAQCSFAHYTVDKIPSQEPYGFGGAEIEAWNAFQAATSTDVPDDGGACPTAQPMGSEANTCPAYPNSQSDLPPNTALSIYKDDTGVIDAWIKHMENPLPSLESTSPSDIQSLDDSSSSPSYSEPPQLFCSSGGSEDIGSLVGRIRTLDDLPSTFDDMEHAAELNCLDPVLFSFSSEIPPSLHFGSVSTSALDSMLGMGSLAADLVNVFHRSRSGSTSTSELSSSESDAGESSVVNGDIASLSLFYLHGGPSGRAYSAYGACSSTSSLPDTLGYF